jgi:hypothetical protein
VGGEDNEAHGGDEFWEWLKEKKEELAEKQDLLKKPGEMQLAVPRIGRLDTLKALQVAWEEKGISSTLDVVKGVKHDSRGVLDVVLRTGISKATYKSTTTISNLISNFSKSDKTYKSVYKIN